jgi:exopolysaccharide production protein ExoZ
MAPSMALSTIGTILLASIAIVALMALPLPPRNDLPGARRRGGPFIHGIFSRLLAPVTSRLKAEYDVQAGRPGEFWHNAQLLRLVSAYAIASIHISQVVRAAHIDPEILNILRFGTDLFVVLAGFLTAHVFKDKGKPAGDYLRTRLIRIVPLYWGFTILAFFVENYLMRNESSNSSELFMSLAFVPYGPFPILYPTWSLLIIVEFSLIIAAFQLVSVKNGIFYSAAFVVLLVVVGQASGIKHPTFVSYTNPILVDFALGIFVYRFARAGTFPLRLPRREAITLAAITVAACLTAVILRPFLWPGVPRLLALGLPTSILLLGVVVLEQHGVYSDAKLVNFLAKCTFAIYLTHWFVNIVSERLVVESGESTIVAMVLLVVTPVIVTYVSVLVYLYAELPLTRYLTDRFSGTGRQLA